MKQVLTLLALGLFLLGIMGCETENPVRDIKEVEITTGTLRGTVQSIDDISIQVRLLKDGQLIAQTETNGIYFLKKIEAGDYILRISAPGYKKTELDVTVVLGETVSLDKVTLEELGHSVSHIHGLLRNVRTGIRLQKVLVKLEDEIGEQYEALTTEDGFFFFENLPVLQTFTLTIEHADYEENEFTVEPIPANETVKLNLKLTPLGIEDKELEPEEAGEGLPIPSEAPEFNLPDGDGKFHALSDYLEQGKKVVLVFYWSGA